jgi:hypothetical protein
LAARPVPCAALAGQLVELLGWCPAFLFFFVFFSSISFSDLVFGINLKTKLDQKLLKLSQKNPNKISADSLFKLEYFRNIFNTF